MQHKKVLNKYHFHKDDAGILVFKLIEARNLTPTAKLFLNCKERVCFVKVSASRTANPYFLFYMGRPLIPLLELCRDSAVKYKTLNPKVII